jgi:hypothetical protein
MAIDALIGLAAAELAFDHNYLEEGGQREELDLAPLPGRFAIGDQPHADAAPLQPGQSIERAGQWLRHRRLAQ